MNSSQSAGRAWSLSERLLLLLSKERVANNHCSQEDWTVEGALSQLRESFHNFPVMISGKEILDFGCGTGFQSVALAKMGARYVVGVDTNALHLEQASQLAVKSGVAEKTEFLSSLTQGNDRRFDVVISQNSMEHFGDPRAALSEMGAALKEDGVLLITFGPPWFAPFGSHMNFFASVPWVNILFDEKTVMKVRSHFRDDGASRYEEVESGLNKMTVRKFEALISETRLKMSCRKYKCVKGVDFLGKLPFIRELFINQINCVLRVDR